MSSPSEMAREIAESIEMNENVSVAEMAERLEVLAGATAEQGADNEGMKGPDMLMSEQEVKDQIAAAYERTLDLQSQVTMTREPEVQPTRKTRGRYRFRCGETTSENVELVDLDTGVDLMKEMMVESMTLRLETADLVRMELVVYATEFDFEGPAEVELRHNGR